MVYEQGDMPNGKQTTLAEGSAETTTGLLPVISVAIDDIAMASLRQTPEEQLACSLCDEPIEGRHSTGLFMWSRGDEVRFDEPPVCPACSAAIGVAAFYRWLVEADEEA